MTGIIATTAIALVLCAATDDDTAADLLDRARIALREGEPDRAIELATDAIDKAPEEARGYQVRGNILAIATRHEEAVKDYSRAIKLAPEQADLYDRRGSEQFKLGHIDESIADFDRFIALRPDQEPAHWKRGISYYYAGRHAEGRKQFEGYQTVDNNDVENAVWRYLCMARSDGVAKARGEILAIRNDGRVPMMEVYALYRGDIGPEDVLRAAKAGSPEDERLNERLFYAHLYLGLYYEAAGDRRLAEGHITEAEKHKIPHYMWDVAHVHAARLRAAQN